MAGIIRPPDPPTDLNLSEKTAVQRRCGSALVQQSCLKSATPLELWWSVGWVHLSGSSSWQNKFRQRSSTAAERDLSRCDRRTWNRTWAWVTLHSESYTPETVGAAGPRCNKNPLNWSFTSRFTLKAQQSFQTHIIGRRQDGKKKFHIMSLSQMREIIIFRMGVWNRLNHPSERQPLVYNPLALIQRCNVYDLPGCPGSVLPHTCTRRAAKPAPSCNTPKCSSCTHVVWAAAGAKHEITSRRGQLLQ